MKTHLLGTAIAICAASMLLMACNSSGLSAKPRAEFTQLACLDVNGDERVNADDAIDPSLLPDFNADGANDGDDASFVNGIDIQLNAAAKGDACTEGSKRLPEYLVAHDFFSRAEVSCGSDDRAVLVLGIAGGVGNLQDDDDAAGVRDIVDALLRAYEGEEYDTIGIVAGSAFYGAENAHTAMEEWLVNAATVHLERFPCLELVTVGFSHGGVTAEVMATRLEAAYGDRILATVVLDRVDEFYNGDLASMPATSLLINVFQTSDGFAGDRVNAPNVLNFDASGEFAPRDGHEGGPMEPVRHVTLDNSKSVRQWIVNVVLARS